MRRLRHAGDRSRGQSAVEFTLFTVAVVLVLTIFLQSAWIAIQKWQFNHFASYAARSWSVDKSGRSPESVLLEVQLRAQLRWNVLTRPWVRYLWAGDPGTNSDGVSGVTYYGVAPVWPMFSPFVGATLSELVLPPALNSLLPSMPSSGLLRFETFVPMEHEADENPNRWDNDCSDPCDDNER